VQEKKFPELRAERAKIEKITIPTLNSAELIKSKTSVASIDDSYVLHLFGLNKHFHSCMVFLFHDPHSQQA